VFLTFSFEDFRRRCFRNILTKSFFSAFRDHDDLLNFEIGDGEFAEGTLNEDELLLSDEGEYCLKKK
jgi:hypothetical protein